MGPARWCASPASRRLTAGCPLADLHDHNAELHKRVLSSPSECLPPFEEAVEEYIRNQNPKVGCAGGAAGVAQRAPTFHSAAVLSTPAFCLTTTASHH